MDYKYIEQLLEAYWQCNTSPEEEEVLRAFFKQSEMPESLKRYRSLFAYQSVSAQSSLGADFDRRMEALIEKEEAAAAATQRTPVSARPGRRSISLRPLFRAAAILAIVLTLGNAAQYQFGKNESSEPDYNYAEYKDTYTDPQVAFDEVSSALQEFSSGLHSAVKADSVLLPKTSLKQ